MSFQIHFKSKTLILVFAILVISCNSEDDSVIIGAVKGRVTNIFGQPLEGVFIKIVGKGIERSQTTNRPLYGFDKLPIGNYTLSAQKDGFEELILNIEVTDATPKNIDLSLNAGEGFLNISKESLNINHQTGGIDIEIYSNLEWTIEANVDWISTDTQRGEGNSAIRVTWEINSNIEQRQAILKIKSRSIEKQFLISQTAKLTITEIMPIYGNLETNVSDSVYLRFNKEVELVNLRCSICTSNTMDFSYHNDKKGLTFRFGSPGLGSDYEFTATAKDIDNFEIIEDFEVQFYEQKVELIGEIQDSYIDDESNAYFLLTRNPNRLYQVSTTDLSIQNTYDLSFTSNKMSFNAFNNKFYLNEFRSPIIHIFDPITEEFQEPVEFTADSQDHPNSPTIIPYDFEFTANGIGLVLLQSLYSSSKKWKLIDSRVNNQISVHPQYDPFGFDEFASIRRNYNGQNLFLTDLTGSPIITLFEQSSERLSTFKPININRDIMVVAPNRANNTTFFGQGRTQLVYNHDNNVRSTTSFIEMNRNSKADFSYNSGEINKIYSINQIYASGLARVFYVFDHDNQKILHKHALKLGIKDLLCTTDGKYLILQSNSALYKISSSFF